MVSIVVVGPSMSGKTTLCSTLVGLPPSSSSHDRMQTRSCFYLLMEVDNTPWHVWDTPALSNADDIGRGWPGEGALSEADIVVVCHDGRHAGPMALVRACGPDRCVIALTRSQCAAVDVSYTAEYLATLCTDGSLVPRARGHGMLMACLWTKACAC